MKIITLVLNVDEILTKELRYKHTFEQGFFYLSRYKMKEIKLTQGKVALVDDSDFEYLNKFNWCVVKNKNGNTFYAIRHLYREGIRTTISMHQEIMQSSKGVKTDHGDHNGLNNQRYNLRICTTSQNGMNRIKQRKETTSQYKGVYLFIRKTKKNIYSYWKVAIKLDGKKIYLGHFGTETLAAIAYNQKAKELFGEFAYLNNIEGD